jgi:hypothetical protein
MGYGDIAAVLCCARLHRRIFFARKKGVRATPLAPMRFRPAFAMATLAAFATALSSTPADVASRAITALVQQPDPPGGVSSLHHLPDYGVAISFSAMYDAMAAFPGQDWSPFLSARLDAYAADPASVAHAVLNNATVPWGYSVGDTTGLFPIAYLSRALHSNNTDPASADWTLALRVADRYVLGWPLRLPDLTISRHAGWGKEPDRNASFLWQDDQFMGLALLSRLSRQPAVPAESRARYRDFVAAQHAGFAKRCQDAATGLYRHGFNDATGDRSCCFWGRANGWVMMAHAEVALALAAAEPPHAALPDVLAVWRRHAAGLAAVAPPAGAADARFHQVLDAPGTFPETSVTAMACYSLATGVSAGFLDRAAFDAPLRAAWAGVAAAVPASGQVEGICEGTGIGENVAFYQARKTLWNISSPGLGAVFRCAVAMEAYLSN